MAMRNAIVWLSIAVSMLAALAGCSGESAVEAQLDTEFTLAAGGSAVITGEDLSIRFVEVISDSRCPKDTICIWMGEASCLIEITQDGATQSKVLTQPGLSAPVTTDYGRYGILFDVQPYPEAGKEIKADDYRLELTITRRTP
jgi:hypothetical protein